MVIYLFVVHAHFEWKLFLNITKNLNYILKVNCVNEIFLNLYIIVKKYYFKGTLKDLFNKLIWLQRWTYS